MAAPKETFWRIVRPVWTEGDALVPGEVIPETELRMRLGIHFDVHTEGRRGEAPAIVPAETAKTFRLPEPIKKTAIDEKQED